MSAYIVPTEQIDAILTAAILAKAWVKMANGGYAYVDEGNVNYVGQVLVNENYRSFNWRYRENHQAPEYIWRCYMGEATTVQMFMHIKNYEYQSCECPDWEKTDAFIITVRIKNALIETLPGYKKAQWGF